MDTDNVSIKTEQPGEDFSSIIPEEIYIKEDFEITNEAPYKCGICAHRTTTDTLLKLHMKSHIVKWVHQCDICNKTFNLVTELNSHILTHKKDLYNAHQVHSNENPSIYAKPNLIRNVIGNSNDFQCNICQKSFINEETLNQHIETHLNHDTISEEGSLSKTVLSYDVSEKYLEKCSSNEPSDSREPSSFNCSNDQTDLSKEMVTTKGKSLFKCKICTRDFPVPSKLRYHMKIHTGEKPFKCEICNKMFPTAGGLKSHSFYVHSNDKPFKCTTCGKGYGSNALLEDHLRLHTGERPYECNICKKRYARKVILNQHLLAHAKDKPFKCDVCNKGFIYMCNLKYHMVTHTTKKPFACNLCDKSYALKKVLSMHMKSHTEEEILHKCQFCGQEFRSLYNMKRHVRVHTGEKPYICPICGKGFSQSATLNRHREAHENISYMCNICENGFSTKSYLKIHQKSHQGKLPYERICCEEKFTVAQKYRDHLKKHKTKFKIVQVEPTIKTEPEANMEVKEIDGDPKSRTVEQKFTIKTEVEDGIDTKENYSNVKCETVNEGKKEEPLIKTEAEDDLEVKEELIFNVP